MKVKSQSLSQILVFLCVFGNFNFASSTLLQIFTLIISFSFQ